MASKKRKNRDSEGSATATDGGDGGFAISKKRMGKPTLVVTAVNFTKEQTDHLNAVCESNETSRAEFVRQAVDFCLESMGQPFPGKEE